MATLLFIPPVAFVILFVVIGLLSRLCRRWAWRKTDAGAAAKKAYSCGEDFSGHLIQPDYSQFFPFAFFFTVLHVVAMVVATVPTETMETFAMAVVYIIGGVIGLFMLVGK